MRANFICVGLAWPATDKPFQMLDCYISTFIFITSSFYNGLLRPQSNTPCFAGLALSVFTSHRDPRLCLEMQNTLSRS